jgi:hypothetical protein
MTPRQEIINYFNRLTIIGSTKPVTFRTLITEAKVGVWALRRETRSKEVLIVAYNTATTIQPLYGRWRSERSMYDYRFATYIPEICEGELLTVMRAAFILDDLSRI